MSTHITRTIQEKEMDLLGNGYVLEKDKLKKIFIRDLPVLRADDGGIICFPEERMENFKVGIFGETGCLRKGTELCVEINRFEKRIIRIEQLENLLKKEKMIRIESLNLETKRISWKKIIDFIIKGKRIIERITLTNGEYLDATLDHVFLVKGDKNKIKKKQLWQIEMKDLITYNQKGLKYWDIKSLESVGEDEVYDIEVEDNHTFCCANGIIVKNSGKTFTLHSIVDRLRYYYGYSTAILNDNQFETTSWGSRNDFFSHGKIYPARELRILNEVAYPLPIVHVYPQNNETQIYSTVVPTVRMSAPFHRIIEQYGAYLKMKPATAKYFLKIFSDDLSWQDKDFTWEQVEELIDEGISKMGENVKSKEMFESTKQSIMASLNEVKTEGYVDIVAREQRYDNQGVPSTNLMIKKEGCETDEGPVFSMLMKHGFVPTLITTDLLHKRYAEPFLADLLDEVFEYPKIYGKPCLAVIPEMKLLMKYATVKERIENFTGRGRMRGVKFIYDTHNYNTIASSKEGKDIIDNTIYAFAFTQKSDTAKKMKRDFDLDKQDEARIINLKQFECLAIASSGEYWIRYDEEGHREKIKGCVKGISLLPLSRHEKPKHT